MPLRIAFSRIGSRYPKTRARLNCLSIIDLNLNLTNPIAGSMNLSIELLSTKDRSSLPASVSAVQIVREPCSQARQVCRSKIPGPKFLVKEILQSSSFPGQNNSITMKFILNVDLHPGDFFTMSFGGS
eukprot:497659-Hanusia_phi.AAC.2